MEKNTNTYFDQLNSFSPCPTGSSLANVQWKEIKYDLSVIIPCYNVESCVKECIHSVLSTRTSYSIQVILVNDGSTDRTPEILNQYMEIPSIKIIHTQNNGVSMARNTGIAASEGRFLLFLDSDDCLLNNCLHRFLSVAIEKDADAVEGLIVNQRESDTNWEESSAPQIHHSNRLTQGYIAGVLFKREFFSQIQFPENFWFEDTILNLRLCDVLQNCFLMELPTYFYRSNPSGISNSASRRAKSIDTFWVTKQLLEDRRNLGLDVNEELANSLLSQIALNFF